MHLEIGKETWEIIYLPNGNPQNSEFVLYDINTEIACLKEEEQPFSLDKMLMRWETRRVNGFLN
jgi:hypothetical protein